MSTSTIDPAKRCGAKRRLDAVILATVIATELVWIGLILWVVLDAVIYQELITGAEVAILLKSALFVGVGVWLSEITRGETP